MSNWTLVEPSGKCERGDLVVKQGLSEDKMDWLFRAEPTSTNPINMDENGGFFVLGYAGYTNEMIHEMFGHRGYVLMRRNKGPLPPRRLPIGSRWSIPAPLP